MRLDIIVRLTLFILFSTFSMNAITQSCKFISVQGEALIDPLGKPFLMKGTNLGNWLVPEGYMF